MTDEQVTILIEEEFKEKTFAVTEQYLEIHQPIYLDNKLKIERIDRDRSDNIIVAYLPILNERFYFAVYLNGKSGEIINIETEPYHCVYFFVTSEKLTAAELKSMTTLAISTSWNKGDLKPNGRSTYQVSALKIMPNTEPDEFEDKLDNLLTCLEKDKAGITELVSKAKGYIQVAMDIHNGNGLIGGPHLDKKSIARMSDLGLSIDFDLYVGGKSFK
ncbi:DUF4279 domain-containing protein [Pedobacter sp. HDW13]|uniref:DUF4279 domain-containing protein n=1 Tax=unclassified Pedobacter TaxID=2628915 RepID=UPI000F5B3023|nr:MULTISPECIES: DUF4279 domain-containing protein [unclassified Pedobacter]QIL38882.1 DUF4279 domain-containing protein [Pedobacter sp. HDW13]RQO67213.1 hypothetical protein DBR40_20910 [Pedobacter sp. KBW01]